MKTKASEKWINVTKADTAYEEQMEAYTAERRHRPLLSPQHARGGKLEFTEKRGKGKWIKGAAPA